MKVRYGLVALLAVPWAGAQAADIPEWINPPTYDCRACHAIDKKLVGPPWKAVAERYKGDPAARQTLKAKVREGGKGNWNEVTGGAAMSPHPDLTDEELDKVVGFVLSLAD
jgi:cytochrome c